MKKEERELYLKNRLEEMKIYERQLYKRGDIQYVAGCDEVGRGPLAGPVVAAMVILPKAFDVLGVDDSKKVSEKKRQELYTLILEKALAYGIGEIDNVIIDDVNILEATKLAMIKAYENANKMLVEKYGKEIDYILFDAMKIDKINKPQKSIIKGDSKSVSIAAASIVAKVTRDKEMIEYHEKYPHYSFNSNKGYGTKAHYEGLKAHGITSIHRKTFLKNLNEK